MTNRITAFHFAFWRNGSVASPPHCSVYVGPYVPMRCSAVLFISLKIRLFHLHTHTFIAPGTAQTGWRSLFSNLIMYFPQVRSLPRCSDRFNPLTLMIGAKRRTSSKANPPGALMFYWSLISTLLCQLTLTSKEQKWAKMKNKAARSFPVTRFLILHQTWDSKFTLKWDEKNDVG